MAHGGRRVSSADPAGTRPASVVVTLLRGLRVRCPRCGVGRLFAGAYRVRERCDACGLVFTPHAHDTWALMYLSTAALTGVVVVLMILVRPSNLAAGRAVVGLVALGLIVASLPVRKGVAVAINYIVWERGERNSG